MKSEAVLALLADLYAQLTEQIQRAAAAEARVAELEAELAGRGR